MPHTIYPAATEGAIWGRLLDLEGQPLSAEAAQSLLRLEFAQVDKDRMRELAAKAREGTLTDAEREQVASYERVGNLLALMKSKARRRLKSATADGSES